MATRFISDLVGTLQSYFRIGSIRLKNNSNVLQARNTADSAFIPIAGSDIRVQGANATNAVVLTAPGGLGGNVTLTLPDNDGSSNQFLKTDGSGTLSWADANSNADLTQIETFDEATSSPMTIFTPPANAIIKKVIIEVTVAAAGGSPTVSVGVASDSDRDMDELESDLKTVAIYEVTPLTDVTGSPDPIILTITPSSQTFDGKVHVHYSNPG